METCSFGLLLYLSMLALDGHRHIAGCPAASKPPCYENSSCHHLRPARRAPQAPHCTSDRQKMHRQILAAAKSASTLAELQPVAAEGLAPVAAWLEQSDAAKRNLLTVSGQEATVGDPQGAEAGQVRTAY